MSTLKAVRGTRDLLPPETAVWNRIEATARSVFARYNFGEIRTPIFEDTGLFARSVGVGECASPPPSPRRHGRRGPRLHRAQARRNRPVAKALLHRSAVSPRAPAK